ncbi:hypothetical protein K503DRAFT_289077 [Rhizopogon vinicolor AM-OR11-026]|uniref:Uncharacterized protein n=1 Tax=Rhizopogon vinicolor AM-OR11-026 TaxID=1314800 RepID=A0A1B7MVH4_9AGAM|nr:hypothetical protein K503DRAFT_289077 [Rhizopogon vinicolor AM-OR11-026]
MRAPPSFFGYQIFAALVSPSSACNSVSMMTLLLHFRLVSSGDSSFMWSHSLCCVAMIWSLDYPWCPTNGCDDMSIC